MNASKILEVTLVVVLCIGLALTLVPLLLVVVGVCLCIGLLAWMCGVPVTVTSGGIKERYRWFTRID